MTCGEFTSRISENIDRTVGDRDRELMDGHAEECPACEERLSGAHAVKERLARLPRLRPSVGFDFALRSRLMMELSHSERNWVVRNILFSPQGRTYAVAAMVILALGVTGFTRLSPFHTEETVTPVALQPQHALQQVSSLIVPPSVAPNSVQSSRGALRRLSQEASYPISQRYLQSHQGTSSTVSVARRGTLNRSYNARVRQVRVRF